jgi:hypothetical protein
MLYYQGKLLDEFEARDWDDAREEVFEIVSLEEVEADAE